MSGVYSPLTATPSGSSLPNIGKSVTDLGRDVVKKFTARVVSSSSKSGMDLEQKIKASKKRGYEVKEFEIRAPNTTKIITMKNKSAPAEKTQGPKLKIHRPVNKNKKQEEWEKKMEEAEDEDVDEEEKEFQMEVETGEKGKILGYSSGYIDPKAWDDFAKDEDNKENFFNSNQAKPNVKKRMDVLGESSVIDFVAKNSEEKFDFKSERKRKTAYVTADQLKQHAQDLKFRMIDITYSVDMNPEEGPIVHLYGLTEGFDTAPIRLDVRGFKPYMFIKKPKAWDEPEVERFLEVLERNVRYELKSSAKGGFGSKVHENFKKLVLDYKLMHCRDIWGFDYGEGVDVIKVTVAYPQLVPTFRSKVEKARENNLFAWDTDLETDDFPDFVYEADFPFVNRFMCDTGITGEDWVKVPKHLYKVTSIKKDDPRMGVEAILNCKYNEVFKMTEEEINTPYKMVEVEGLDPSIDRSPTGKVVLSKDIEVLCEKRIVPKDGKNAVCNIGITVRSQKRLGDRKFYCFTLGSCPDIYHKGRSIKVYSYEDEREMLRGFIRFLLTIDPDVITGWNINNYDWPYLIKRAEELKIREFEYLTRNPDRKISVRASESSTRGKGVMQNNEVTVEGRTNFDMMTYVRGAFTLRSYQLGEVGQHFLGIPKEEMDYEKITLHHSTLNGRKRLTIYCAHDAFMPDELMVQLNAIPDAEATAYDNHMTINSIISRGLTARCKCNVYDHGFWRVDAKTGERLRVLVRTRNEAERKVTVQEKYGGAYVEDAVRGLHTDPITTVDFESLYPSIMREYNMCPSSKGNADRLRVLGYVEGRDFIIVASGKVFVTPEVWKGVFPSILDDKLSQRKKSKMKMGIFEKRVKSLQAEMDLLNGKYKTEFLKKFPIDKSPTSRVGDDNWKAWANDNNVLNEILFNTKLKAIINSNYGEEYKKSNPKGEVGDIPWQTWSVEHDVLGNFLSSDPKMMKAMNGEYLGDFKRLHPNGKIGDKLWEEFAVENQVPKELYISQKNAEGTYVSGTELLVEVPIDKPILVGSSEWTSDMLNSKRLQSYYNCKQNAEKLTANSMYGALGAAISFLYDKEVAESVTAEGQVMIKNVRAAILKRYTKENGFPCTVQVIYGDTDSLFFKQPGMRIAEAMKMGKEMAAWVTKELFWRVVKDKNGKVVEVDEMCEVVDEKGYRVMKEDGTPLMEMRRVPKKEPGFVNLAYEKTWYPVLIMYSKKKYCGIMSMYDANGKIVEKQKFSGIEVSRRDNCLFVPNTMKECFKMIFKDGIKGADKAIEYVKKRIGDLLTGQISWHELIISGAIKKELNQYTTGKTCFSELAKRMNERAGFQAIGPGMRLKCVIVKGTSKKKYDRSEDPLWAWEKKMPLDLDYYLYTAFAKAIIRLFKPIYFDKIDPSACSRNERDLKLFIGRMIFTGDHMLKVEKNTTNDSSISKRIRNTYLCISCKKSMPIGTDDLICGRCKENKLESLLDDSYQIKSELMLKRAVQNSDCQRCVGNEDYDHIQCTSEGCTNLWESKLTSRKLNDINQKLDRLISCSGKTILETNNMDW